MRIDLGGRLPADTSVPDALLDIPQRMAVVMRDLNAEQDGCTEKALLGWFTPDEIARYSGEAERLANSIFVRREEPTYDRKTRVAQAVARVANMLPQADDIRDTLALHFFSPDEIEHFWSEVMLAAGTRLARTRQPRAMPGEAHRG